VFIAIAIKSFARQVATNASVAAGAQDDTSSAKEIAMAETNEDPLALTGEDPVVETGKASVAATSETQVAETREEHPAVMDFENLQIGNGGGEVAASAASSFAGCFQMFADEVRRQSKKRRPKSRASRHRL
jgi:hypothetical protein